VRLAVGAHDEPPGAIHVDVAEGIELGEPLVEVLVTVERQMAVSPRRSLQNGRDLIVQDAHPFPEAKRG